MSVLKTHINCIFEVLKRMIMAASEINEYIIKRYKNWLDSAQFRCRQAGIPDEAMDVLQEVIVSLLQKEDNMLLDLLHRKNGEYTELDWFVIRMIELNATSPTSPYRHKTRNNNIDQNVDLKHVNVIDDSDEDEDVPGRIFSQTELVRRIFNSLELSAVSRKIFTFRFFLHENFADWPGKESPKFLYDTYNRVILIIKGKIFKELYLKGKRKVA